MSISVVLDTGSKEVVSIAVVISVVSDCVAVVSDCGVVVSISVVVDTGSLVVLSISVVISVVSDSVVVVSDCSVVVNASEVVDNRLISCCCRHLCSIKICGCCLGLRRCRERVGSG